MTTSWWQRLFGVSLGPRVEGDPPSANGASSFHLRWDLDEELVAATVDLTVLDPPTVNRLYFWALQADFLDPAGHPAGGAHFGLQWHPGHPYHSAVNWGGYDAHGRELTGTESELPSAQGNVNTRDFHWYEGVSYRLTIALVGAERSEAHGGTLWRGSITNLSDGDETVVRDLVVDGDRIRGVVMWSEVFARCDHPSVTVRWSNPRGLDADGVVVSPSRVAVNYQSHENGGCANTNSFADSAGIRQITSVERTTALGTMMEVPRSWRGN